jgi:hypothetical protein
MFSVAAKAKPKPQRAGRYITARILDNFARTIRYRRLVLSPLIKTNVNLISLAINRFAPAADL